MKQCNLMRLISLLIGVGLIVDCARIAKPEEGGTTRTSTSSDWPCFRGPQRSGVATDRGIPTEWSATRNIAWKTALPGPGSSSPITFGDHVYVTCYSGYGLTIEDPGDPAKLKRHLVCVDRNRGSILWNSVLPSEGDITPFTEPIAIGRHGYASSTPAADASGVYVFYGTSGLAAYGHDGKLKWRRRCGTKTHAYGTAASPVLVGDLVIIHADVESHALVAFEKTAGRPKWTISNESGPSTWSTPVVGGDAGHEHVVYVSGDGRIAAVDPKRGAKLWEYETEIGRINACPILEDGVCYLLAGPSRRSAAVRMTSARQSSGLQKLWELNKGSYVSSAVYHRGHLYWAAEDGGLVYCVDAATGKLAYEARLNVSSGLIYASPVVVDNKIYYASALSGTMVVAAKPEFQLLATNVIETDDSLFNGSPAVSRGQLFLRSNQYLYCIAPADD